MGTSLIATSNSYQKKGSMGNTIDHIRLNNTFYNPINNWKHNVNPTREDKENIDHKGRKGFGDAVTAEDIFDNPTEEDKQLFHEAWVNELRSERKSFEEFDDHLANKGFDSDQGYKVLANSIQNSVRAKSWAEENEKRCKVASDSMTASIVCGITNNVLDSESIPSVIRHGVNLAQGIAQGTRAYNQYSTYNRPDDDVALNVFEGTALGNKLSSALGQTTAIAETKIKPWAMVLTSFLPEPYRTSTRQILTLPNSLWWRVRMLAHINQEFGTDLLKYIFHKPLTLLKDRESIRVIEEIKAKKNLDPSYFLERHCKNAGIKKKRDYTVGNLVEKTLSNLRDSFSSDTKVRSNAARRLNETIAPVFGTYGAVAVTTGAVAQPILKTFNLESKIANFLYSSGVLSQQSIYFFRFLRPLQVDTEHLKRQLHDRNKTNNWTKEQIEQRKVLLSKQESLSYLGTSCFLVNALNTFLKLKKFENSYMKKGASMIDGLSEDLIAKFFSQRRYVEGYKFRVENPEFYKQGN